MFMKQRSPFGAVKRNLVGDNNPSVYPGTDPTIYGRATLTPLDPVEVRSFQSYRLIYTVGRLGIDDTGGIRIAWRSISDAGRPQMTDPMGDNYVTASSNGAGRLALRYDHNGGVRPWNEVLTIEQVGGYLREGDKITIQFGDTSKGSAGMLTQTFVEGGRDFRVMADVQATGIFIELPDTQLAIPIVAGPAVNWHAVLPTLRRPSEVFHLGLKAEDKWGNPTAQAKAALRFETSIPVMGLPETLDYAPKDRAMSLENLTVSQGGTVWIKVFIGEIEVAQAGPLVIKNGDIAGFWGDLHGQTGETVGTNTIESYFDFARNKAFLDVTSHQGNDFQLTGTFWQHLNDQTAAWDKPGRFTVFPGYEWSGNTAVGGDHNVFFRKEGCAIRRCSHVLLDDQTDMDTDANTLTDLYQAFVDSGDDVVLYAHVGGRYADIFYDHNPLLETAVEVHSAWGTFEWILTDGFGLGRRVGVVCNSDGHKGRPGASYPGDSIFGALGGLTCFLADKNDRDSIFEAQRRRHHYGTTGCRMFMDVRINLTEVSTVYKRNPDAMPDTAMYQVNSVMMGDIVQTSADEVELAVSIKAHAGIERIEIRNGADVLETLRPYSESDLGRRIRVLWSGAEYRGRDRVTTWSGRAQFNGTVIERFETINQWNPDQLFEQRGSDTVTWNTVTTGNFRGCDAWLDDDTGDVAVTTNHGALSLDLGGIGLGDVVLDAGGLERKLKILRLPENRLKNEMTFARNIKLNAKVDNPIWICVFTEDGFQAWSSPVYVFQ
jgi:hypothetical protein